MTKRNILAVVAFVLAVSACGLALEEEAQPITSVPFSLLGTTTSTSEALPADPAFGLELFWISDVDESLIQVVRPQEDPPSVQDSLNALIGGPNEAEAIVHPDARSPASVSRTLNPVALPVNDGHLIIQVEDGTELRAENRLPAAVIVCTVTQFELIVSVEIQDADGVIPLSDLSSQSIEGRATRANFDDCTPTVQDEQDGDTTDEGEDTDE